MNAEQIIAELTPIGLKAVLAQPKVKLIAKVNHRDNFALHFAHAAHDAMLDHAVAIAVDGPKGKRMNDWSDWLNDACSTKTRRGGGILADRELPPQHCAFDVLSRNVAGMAYDKLRPQKKPKK